MKRQLLTAAIAVVLAVACTSTPATPPPLETEDQKTLYALGLSVAGNLAQFQLTEAELALVEAGIRDATLKRPPRVEIETYRPKIMALASTRASAGAEETKRAGAAFVEKILAGGKAQKTASGAVYEVITEGSGASPTAANTVKVHYTGSLIDGSVFDSSVQRDQPAQFPLGRVIKCWTEGLQTMKVGGKTKLYCPADIAYGDGGRPPKIPGGATLIFEIELLEILE
jgi:FKBP-type peptidyl-prolyl cis-trans isomerase FkpA/FKBP-type peptidyl-prolyl cis-trans isomerase FklB